MQAKSVGNSGLVDKLEADARLMSYQAQVAQRLEVRREGMPAGTVKKWNAAAGTAVSKARALELPF
eukprot:1159045-Pelagomonas_calceolata.AAC.16